MGGAFGAEEANTTCNVLVWWGVDALDLPRQGAQKSSDFPAPMISVIRRRYCYQPIPYHVILQPDISKSVRLIYRVSIWINSGHFVHQANECQKTIDYDAVIEIRDQARTVGHKLAARLVVTNRGLFVASVGEVKSKLFCKSKRGVRTW